MALFLIEKGIKTYSLSIMEDVEFVNPRDFMKDFHIRSIIPTIIKEKYLEQKMPKVKMKELVLRESSDIAEAHISSLEQMELPPQIQSLLDTDYSKKEQVRLLNGMSITRGQLGAIFIQAGKKGYSYSNYVFDGIPKTYNERNFPSFIRVKDDRDVETSENHLLSEGQSKDIVIQSKKIIARFLDKNNHWHCFYQTQNGAYGKEKGKNHG